MARRIPLVICFLSGLLMFAVYFSSHPVAEVINLSVPIYWQIVFAFTLIIGVLSYVKNNLRGISRRQDRPYRMVSLAGFAVMPIAVVTEVAVPHWRVRVVAVVVRIRAFLCVRAHALRRRV